MLREVEKELMAEENKDTVPAHLTKGEFVFSVPAIIALGEGSHEKGVKLLEGIHEMLRQKAAEKYVQKDGLTAAGLDGYAE